MKNSHSPVFLVPFAADEPIGVRTVNIIIEQPGEAGVIGIGEMAAMHDGDTQALSSGLQH